MWQSPNWVDYSIIALVILSALISLLRGFVREALALATWFVAIWTALHYAKLLAETGLLSNYLHGDSVRVVAAFLFLFVAILIIGTLISSLCCRLIKATGLGATDKIVGVFFGIARGVLLVAIVLLIAEMMNWTHTSGWQDSQLTPHFQGLMAWVQGLVPEQLTALLHPKGPNEVTETTEAAATTETTAAANNPTAENTASQTTANNNPATDNTAQPADNNTAAVANNPSQVGN